MGIKSFTGAICGIFLLNITQASSAVVFYTDIAAFNADTNTSIIGFDGIAPADDKISPPANAVEINNIIFTTDPLQSSARVFGKNVGGTDSDLFVANNGNNIIIDLSLTGSAITAAGGIFGDYDGPAGQQVQFNIYDSLGVTPIDTQTVNFGDMFKCLPGQVCPQTFFGWIANGGDEITRIELIANLDPNGNPDPDFRILYSALDDFQYGTVVPVPAAAWLFGSGLLGLIAVARRRS